MGKKHKKFDMIEQMFEDFKLKDEQVIRSSFYWLNDPAGNQKHKVDERLVTHAIRRYRRRRVIPDCVPRYIAEYRVNAATRSIAA